MMVRTHIFRVSKAKEKETLRYMNGEVRRMILGKPGLPGCLAVFFARNQKRPREYVWVSIWKSKAAWNRTERRKEWKEVGRREEELFSGAHPMIHYDVLWHKWFKKVAA